MMQQAPVTGRTRDLVIAVDRFACWISSHWLALFIVTFGGLVLTPFLAPALMKMGATGPANVIYAFYSLLCHQLPQRSLFFFGPQPMPLPFSLAGGTGAGAYPVSGRCTL